jgi:two-component system OmpR family sensor kinase
MSDRTSITRRLIVTLTLGALLLWTLGAIATIAVVRNQLDVTLDGGLREIAERLLPLAVDSIRDDGDGDVENHVERMVDVRGGEEVVYQVRRSDGTLAMRSHDAPVAPFAVPLAEGYATLGPWRIYTHPDRHTGFVIQVAQAVERRDVALWGSIFALLLPAAALVPLAALGIYFAVRSGLAPLRRLDAEIARRDATNLAPIGLADLPAELVPIAETVEGLLTRLRAALEAERAFAANSAHELRTPIAASLAQTQRLIAELESHPAVGRARQVEATLQRLRELAAKLLELSRADAGMARLERPVDLLPALLLVVEEARRQSGLPERLRLELPPDAQLEAPVDVDAFGIALRNLIENALRHGPPEGTVTIAMPHAGVVSVANSGPVVGPEQLETLVRRFERGNTTAGGSGLGLAIVDAIMRQAGGRLELASPAPGAPDGFAAILHLPQR